MSIRIAILSPNSRTVSNRNPEKRPMSDESSDPLEDLRNLEIPDGDLGSGHSFNLSGFSNTNPTVEAPM